VYIHSKLLTKELLKFQNGNVLQLSVPVSNYGLKIYLKFCEEKVLICHLFVKANYIYPCINVHAIQACRGSRFITPPSFKLSSGPTTLFAAMETRAVVNGG